MRPSIAAALCLAAVAAHADTAPPDPKKKPAPPPSEIAGDACKRDADCEITTFEGCCGSCCHEGAHAASHAELARQMHHCAIIDCGPLHCTDVACPPNDTPPPEALVAKCKKGWCVAERRGPECDRDDECTVVYTGGECAPNPCGCCPLYPIAVSTRPQPMATTPPPPPPPPPKAKPKRKKPEEPPEQQPNCSPCPPPPPAKAGCRFNRCLLVPVPAVRQPPALP